MRLLSLKLFLLFIYLLFPSITSADQKLDIKNLKIHKEPKKVNDIMFKNSEDTTIFLDDFKGKLVVINFWATWCAPCREEMPSLDILQSNKNFQDLIILPINVGKENKDKAKKFFNDLQIKNLKLYYDDSVKLANTFSLIGLPTTIFINKEGDEFARIIGSIDFGDQNFIKWLSNYN
jgi:thiol-disulfide isomerase/thioredoxin